MKNIYTYLLMFLLISVMAASGAYAETIQVADKTIEYSEVVASDIDENGVDELTSYYNGETLVLSVYDRDEDGVEDLWLVFNDGWYVELEAGDTDGDGEPDAFYELDEDGNVLDSYGEGIDRLAVDKESVDPEEAMEEDLVGDLDDIGPGAGGGGGVGLLLLLVFTVAAGYWYYKNKMTK